MTQNASILAALKASMRPDQWQALLAELRAKTERDYRRGYGDGLADGEQRSAPPPRPLVSDEALATLRGALRSGTVRLGVFITTVSAALLDEGVRAQVVELLGPRAYPALGIAAGLAMLVQRVRTVMSLRARGASASERTGEAPHA